MPIPSHLILTAEDIRYIRNSQLAILTRIYASSFPKWDQGKTLSERTLERIASGLCTTKLEVLKGFELRRQDVEIARAAQSKANQLITFLGLDQEQTPA